MAHTFLDMTKVIALAAAVVVTMGVQGSMLASFDHLATSAIQTPTNAACNVVTQPATEVRHARG